MFSWTLHIPPHPIDMVIDHRALRGRGRRCVHAFSQLLLDGRAAEGVVTCRRPARCAAYQLSAPIPFLDDGCKRVRRANLILRTWLLYTGFVAFRLGCGRGLPSAAGAASACGRRPSLCGYFREVIERPYMCSRNGPVLLAGWNVCVTEDRCWRPPQEKSRSSKFFEVWIARAVPGGEIKLPFEVHALLGFGHREDRLRISPCRFHMHARSRELPTLDQLA
jgi:hypothetical protein